MGHTMEDYKEYEKLADEERKGMATKPELAAKIEYPMTESGQSDFMQDFMTRDLAGERFAGLLLLGAGLAAGSREADGQIPKHLPILKNRAPEEMSGRIRRFFDYNGNALQALETIRKFQP